MPDDESKTQKTPKGYEIPVPTRKQVLGDLEKLARPKPKGSTPPPSGPEK